MEYGRTPRHGTRKRGREGREGWGKGERELSLNRNWGLRQQKQNRREVVQHVHSTSAFTILAILTVMASKILASDWLSSSWKYTGVTLL